MSYAATDPTALATARTQALAARASGSTTVTEPEAAAAAALYASMREAGWFPMDALVSLATERTAAGERFRAS